MSLAGERVLLRIYLQSADRAPHAPTHELIVQAARQAKLAGVTVLKGILGAGYHGILKNSAWSLAEHVPIIVEIVETAGKISEFLQGPLDKLMIGGMATLERAAVILYRHKNQPHQPLDFAGELKPLSTVPHIEPGSHMTSNTNGVLLRVFIGESDRFENKHLYEAIVQKARDLGIAGATVLRGTEGFGANSVVHKASLLAMSSDLPIVIEIVDTEEKIRLLQPHLETMVKEGMITMEYVAILMYRHSEKGALMPIRWDPREHLVLGKYFCKWLIIAAPVAAVIGSAIAMFLWALDYVTQLRWKTDTSNGLPWLLYLLPFAGIFIGWMYHLLGKSVEAGNNLIIEQIHEPGGGVPSRMAPMVLIGTLLTHLFGGSAGREGTAVQMGGSIASTASRWFKLDERTTRTLLMCGVAAGFGAVFGTPITGAIFAVEVLAIGIVNFQSIVPCLIASIVGDWIARELMGTWSIRHTQYAIGPLALIDHAHSMSQLDWLLLGKVAIAAIAFGLVSMVFVELAHGLSWLFKHIKQPMLRPALGGIVVIAMAYIIGPDYLGIGVKPDPAFPNQICIVSCFHTGGATYWSWAWKILFTAITLSSGFKGGEVTPLFFIGAALGNAMAKILHAPVDLFAGLGFVAVFAGATNTPLACTIMGIELFAADSADLIHSGFAVYLATACFLSYLLSGRSSVYRSQRISSDALP